MAKKTHPISKDSSDSFSIIDIYNSIYKIKSKLDKFQRKIAKNLNLTLTQYCILRQLWKINCLQFKELATGCHITPPTLTGVIDTMEKKDLVTREINPNDRRSLIIKCTEKGMGIQKLAAPFDDSIKKLFNILESSEIQQLGQLLQKLKKKI
ncbi:MAG: MarR family winged helix-turn-helix transcriptional regulator [Promethearchaeota archaeon]